MNDRDFSALERRLARALEGGPAPAPSAHAGAFRRDVLDLLAECRRLREPPDVSGLMTAAEVEDLRKRLSVLSIPALDHIDAQAALVRELYGVVSDVHAEDPGRQALLERGRAEGRGEAAALLGGLGMAEAAGKVRSLLWPRRPPPPPAESEREAGRLREALARLVAAAGKVTSPGGDAWVVPLAAAYEAARLALGEGA